MPYQRNLHFHIRWGSGRIDWERFTTHKEARQGAIELALPRERYSVEQFDGSSCQHCAHGFTIDLEVPARALVASWLA